MKPTILLGAGLGLALALPAAAATTGAGMPTAGTAQAGQQNAPTPPAAAKRMYHSLKQAGFTDVHIMPHSYLVRAKDPDGNPVMMVVNPDSVAAVTAIGPKSSGNQTAQESGGSKHQ